MAGVFPDGGVAASATTNAVDVATNCTNELFYSIARCQPRFNPAAMNAVMSEILNLATCNGATYDCTRLDNLCMAVTSMTGVTNATANVAITNGKIVACDGGDGPGEIFVNLTGATITPTAVDCATLRGLGLTPVDNYAEAEAAVAAGTDKFGVAIAVGDQVLTLADGTTVNLSSGAVPRVANAGEVGTTDSFGNTIAAGDTVVEFGGGQTLTHGNAANPATVAAAVAAGTDTFGTPFLTGQPVITFPNGDTLAGGAAVAEDVAAGQIGVADSFGNLFRADDQVLTLPDGRLLRVPNAAGAAAGGNAVTSTVPAGDPLIGTLDAAGNTIAAGDQIVTLVSGENLVIPGPAAAGGSADTPYTAGQNAGDWTYTTLGQSNTFNLPAGPTANGYWEVTVRSATGAFPNSGNAGTDANFSFPVTGTLDNANETVGVAISGAQIIPGGAAMDFTATWQARP